MKIWKKTLSVGLSLALCAGLVAPALAVTYDIADGSVYVESDDDGVYSYQGARTDEGISRDKDITVIGTTTKNTITVGAGVTDTTITLKDVNIDVSGTGNYRYSSKGEAAFSVVGNGNTDCEKNTTVTVELDGKNTLKSGVLRAGLELNDGASVTVQDGNEDGGSLMAQGSYAPGIGSGSGVAGNITIDSGSTVTAIAKSGGAGIGTHGGVVGDITIDNGSTVTATGGYNGAGIGTSSGVAGNITINNGSTVIATGDNAGAGIGSGYDGTTGNITISGSTVIAKAGRSAAGIGGSYRYKNGGMTGDITIDNGSTVTAMAGYNAAGIGGGGYDNDIRTIGDTGNIKIGDDVTLLALSNNTWAVNPKNEDSTATGNILVGKLSGYDYWENPLPSTVFTVLDKNGNVVREFDLRLNTTIYFNFAINLPKDGTGYIIVQKDAEGNILRYLVDGENTALHKTTEVNEDGSVKPKQENLVLKNSTTKYEFVDANGKELPDEVKNLLDGYAAGYDDVEGVGGNWVFQGWKNTEGIVDGKLQDTVTFTGTWDFDGYNYEVTVNPDNGEEPETQTGKVGGDTPKEPTEPTKTGHKFTGWEVVDEEGNPIVDENGDPVNPFDPDFIPDEDGQKIIVKAKWDGDEYTVTVDPDNGEEPETQTGKVGGDTPKEPTDPTKTGHKFTGWEVVDEEGNPIVDENGDPVNPFDPDFIPDEDGQKIIVKAKWEKLPSKPDPDSGRPDPVNPNPVNPNPGNPDPVNPDPEKPDPVNPGSEEPVDIEDPKTPLDETPDETVDIEPPETPLDETPDETVDIENPEVPLDEAPEASDSTVEIDVPDVPLGDVPQTGEASTAMWLAVLLVCGMGLVYVNTGKRKENA